MDGPRAPLVNELPNVIQFLDRHLRPEENWSITNEYPVAFSETNLANLRIITRQKEVLSHALIKPMIIRTPAGLFKVAGLGSVVTSSEHRHQGLSSQIIESCVEAARQQCCDFAILWTNLYDFYRRMNFELAGTEISLLLDHELDPAVAASGASRLSAPKNLKFLESPKIAAEPLHRLYSRHTVSSLRSIEETRKYLQIPNARVYTAWDENGTLKAYAVEGKGADLNGYVHEWGGGVQDLLPLLAHIRRAQKRPITIIAPRHAQNLIRQCRSLGMSINEGHLGMIRILDFDGLFQKIKRHARALGIPDLVLEKQDQTFYIGLRDNVLMTESEADLTRLVFGPLKASDVQKFSSDTATALERVLPLGMWIWGWDSV